MDARVIEHGGVASARPTARYYPGRPGYELIGEATRSPMSVKQFYQMTTTLAPANPLEHAPRWFWLHEVGVAEKAADRAKREAAEAAGRAQVKRRGRRQ